MHTLGPSMEGRNAQHSHRRNARGTGGSSSRRRRRRAPRLKPRSRQRHPASRSNCCRSSSAPTRPQRRRATSRPVAKTHHKHVATKAHHGPLPANGPAITTVAAVPAIDPPAEPALAFAEPMTNVVTVAGQSVQVAEPDDVNDIDRTADTLDKLARKNVAAADAAVAPAPEAPASSALIVTSTSNGHKAKVRRAEMHPGWQRRWPHSAEPSPPRRPHGF